VCSLGELWLEGAEAGYDSNGGMVKGDEDGRQISLTKISSMFW